MDFRTKFLVAFVNAISTTYYYVVVIAGGKLLDKALKALQKLPSTPHKPRVLMPNGTSYRIKA